MRILLAPNPITPTKPLTPSHLKALIWLDMTYRATSYLADVTFLVNRTTCDTAGQLEAWAVDALAEHLAQDEGLRPWLAPRLLPAYALEGASPANGRCPRSTGTGPT